ncbi:NAD-dependent protein deacetylase sirtuin-7 [Taenia solium]|eukprot:TsM_000486400 transcript=TsM_000486400 gene=TsM_000486400
MSWAVGGGLVVGAGGSCCEMPERARMSVPEPKEPRGRGSGAFYALKLLVTGWSSTYVPVGETMGETIGPSGLSEESSILSDLIRKHRGRIVIYTGAGVSTAAAIPDYRGTHGLYRNSTNSGRRVVGTRLRLPEASFAKPTFTHMAICALVSHGYVRHVVSQNVDCLHLRSGLPRKNLSELHGNLFIEKLTYRAFDVAENTARGRHMTGRICSFCCDAPTFSSLQRSITLGALKLLFEKKNASKDDSVAAIHRAAQNICKDFGRCIMSLSFISSANLLCYYYSLFHKFVAELHELLELQIG